MGFCIEVMNDISRLDYEDARVTKDCDGSKEGSELRLLHLILAMDPPWFGNSSNVLGLDLLVSWIGKHIHKKATVNFTSQSRRSSMGTSSQPFGCTSELRLRSR